MNGDKAQFKAWISSLSNLTRQLPADIGIVGQHEEGGQGIIYRGTVSGADAAIKVYFPGQLKKRIDREVSALKTITCPSIVTLLWAGSISYKLHNLPVVATTFVEGTPLNDRIQKQPLSHNELGVLAYDVANAIRHMWQPHRIVHRDLKPGNLILRPSGRACVIDLGLARHTDKSSLTILGVTWGTYGYFSPEQARAVRQLTCKSDVFALGIILVESAMGRHPTGRDQARLLTRRLHEALPSEVAAWNEASLLKDMLHPRQTKRPNPEKIVQALSRYKQP